MRPTWLARHFVLAQFALAFSAHAGPIEFCVDRQHLWCLGTLTFEVKEKEVRYQASAFSDGDLLIELTEHGSMKRMFKRDGERKPLYFGLSNDEQQPGGIGLKFSYEGIQMMLGLVAFAFPDGPATVPAEATEKRLDISGAHAKVQAWRMQDGRIGFRVFPRDDDDRFIPGETSSVRPAPLPVGVVASWGQGVHADSLVRLKPMPTAPDER
jgi:hypothetical protein